MYKVPECTEYTRVYRVTECTGYQSTRMNRVHEYIDWTQRYMEKLNELVIAMGKQP